MIILIISLSIIIVTIALLSFLFRNRQCAGLTKMTNVRLDTQNASISVPQSSGAQAAGYFWSMWYFNPFFGATTSTLSRGDVSSSATSSDTRITFSGSALGGGAGGRMWFTQQTYQRLLLQTVAAPVPTWKLYDVPNKSNTSITEVSNWEYAPSNSSHRLDRACVAAGGFAIFSDNYSLYALWLGGLATPTDPATVYATETTKALAVCGSTIAKHDGNYTLRTSSINFSTGNTASGTRNVLLTDATGYAVDDIIIFGYGTKTEAEKITAIDAITSTLTLGNRTSTFSSSDSFDCIRLPETGTKNTGTGSHWAVYTLPSGGNSGIPIASHFQIFGLTASHAYLTTAGGKVSQIDLSNSNVNTVVFDSRWDCTCLQAWGNGSDYFLLGAQFLQNQNTLFHAYNFVNGTGTSNYSYFGASNGLRKNVTAFAITGTGATAAGDPEVQPVFGPVYTMPHEVGFYRALAVHHGGQSIDVITSFVMEGGNAYHHGVFINVDNKKRATFYFPANGPPHRIRDPHNLLRFDKKTGHLSDTIFKFLSLASSYPRALSLSFTPPSIAEKAIGYLIRQSKDYDRVSKSFLPQFLN